jgi:iron(III) transport system substrate-binding protein
VNAAVLRRTLNARFAPRGIVGVLALVASCPALWRSPPAFAEASVIADLARYSGTDRAERLIAGAKREGSVTVYTSAASDDVAALAAAFEKKYGLKVQVWRSSSENILQRSVVEARGRRFDADVFETGVIAMESMQRERLLQEINSPALSEVIPAAIPPHREWIGTRYNIFSAAYNTGLIKPDEVPKRYEDLLDRRWKGKLGVEAEDSDWFGAVVEQLGEQRGLKLFRDIVAANGVSVRKGHTLLASLVVSGEVPFALDAYAYKLEQLRKSGAPLAWFVMPPGVARFEAVGVARRAAHPHAAILFFDFMLTDGQEILLQRDFFPASRKGKPAPGGTALTFIDAAKGLDENNKWNRYFRDIFLNQAR